MTPAWIYDNARPELDIVLHLPATISWRCEAQQMKLFIDSLEMFNLAVTWPMMSCCMPDNRVWPSLWSGSLALIVILISIRSWSGRS